LGWDPMQEPVLSGFDYRGALNPLETWGDMTHLIDKEAWFNNHYPMSIAYFCSSLSDPEPLPMTPHGPMASCEQMDQAKANRMVKEHARVLVRDQIAAILPKTRTR